MTSNCINSLVASEQTTEMEIILVESNKNFTKSGFIYPDFVKILIPEADFNFHKFLNIGIKESRGQYIALCNNDLIFYKNWFSEIYKISTENPNIKSFSPSGKIDDYSFSQEFEFGYKIRTHVMGWCIVAFREVFEKIDYLDETFDFGCADNDYAMTLKKYNIKHVVVHSSKVEHLEREKAKKQREGLDAGYYELIKNVDVNMKIPDYLLKNGNEYLQHDKKSLEDFIKYHNKWGSPTLLYRKNKIADLFIRLHLGFLNRIIL